MKRLESEVKKQFAARGIQLDDVEVSELMKGYATQSERRISGFLVELRDADDWERRSVIQPNQIVLNRQTIGRERKIVVGRTTDEFEGGTATKPASSPTRPPPYQDQMSSF